jgi:hypothetical protein
VTVPPLEFALPVAVALDAAADPPDTVPVLELPELHPASVIAAVAATVQAASHRLSISFIASGLHRLKSREYRECMCYTSGRNTREEALAFASAHLGSVSEVIQSH